MLRISIHSLLLATMVVACSLSPAYAVTSDGSIFFDGFGDFSKWTIQETDCTPGAWVEDGILRFDSSTGAFGYLNVCTTNALDYGGATEWVTQTKFRVNGAWGSGLTWTDGTNWRETGLLVGMSGRPYDWTADYGLLLADGSDISVFSLTWGAFNSTTAPEALAIDLYKSQWYTVSMHHKADATVDIYLDGSLIANKAALPGIASYIGLLETSGNTYGAFDLEYVSVGAPVPEPGSMCALALGLAGLAGSALRRRR